MLKATDSKQLSLEDVRSGNSSRFNQCQPIHTFMKFQLDPVTIANISMYLSDDDDLSSGIVLPSSRHSSTSTFLKEYIAILACADNPTPEGRASSFVSVGGGGSGKVQVEYEIICRRLRQRVLEAVARERYGDDAVRIIRILLAMNKIDEKHVSSCARHFWVRY